MMITLNKNNKKHHKNKTSFCDRNSFLNLDVNFSKF